MRLFLLAGVTGLLWSTCPGSMCPATAQGGPSSGVPTNPFASNYPSRPVEMAPAPSRRAARPVHRTRTDTARPPREVPY